MTRGTTRSLHGPGSRGGASAALGAGPRHEEGCSDVVKATEPRSWRQLEVCGKKNKEEPLPDAGCGGPRSGHGPPESSGDSERRGEW